MRVSFIHSNDEQTASYRYRAQRPANALKASVNDESADILVFAKPKPSQLPLLQRVQAEGRIAIVDCCDVHWQKPSVMTMIAEADAVTVNTPYMQALVQEDCGRSSTIIIDPYEYDEVPPHCEGVNLLWYGHPNNADSFNRIAPLMAQYPFKIVTNRSAMKGTASAEVLEWSIPVMLREFSRADIVVMPETAPHKSANRTIEAIRQGCFVVAEPHPSLVEFPGIWIGNIREGILWTSTHLEEARARTTEAQAYVRSRYGLEPMVNAWKTLLRDYDLTSAAGKSIGTAGSTLMASMAVR